jgi:hypothetical protein
MTKLLGDLDALARDQVEFGHLLTFVSRGDQSRATIELIDNVKDPL